MATITLTAYGPLREVLGDAPVTLESSATTMGEFLDWLHVQYPALAAWRSRIACALDDALVGAGEALPAKARIDLIPPVSGG